MGSTMLALPAELTLKGATATLRTLEPAIAAEPGPVITLDASALKQIDSSALAVLLQCRRQAEARQASFQVINAPCRLTELAQLYGLQDLLELKA